MGLLRANPALLAVVIFVAIATLVLGIVSLMMARAGANLRPIVFIAVFFGIVAGPQLALHLGQAVGWLPKRELVWVPAADRATLYGYGERQSALAVRDGKFADPSVTFGPDVDATLITDLRQMRVGPFVAAEIAQMAISRSGGSTIVARYATPGAAQQAATGYLTAAAGLIPPPGSDGSWTVSRPTGDVLRTVVAGRTLMILTGRDAAAVERRFRQSRVIVPNQADPTVTAEALDFWLYRPIVLFSVTLLLVTVATLWFFRGSAWATTIRSSVTPAQSADALRRRLLDVNALDVPFSVTQEPTGRLAVTWRFADARWVDLARAHGMRRTHRILIDLDPQAAIARVTDQQSAVDWSAGVSGGSLRWSTSRGIVFFQREYQRVFGLQLDASGRFVPQLSYAYTFDLQEMKAPLISAVTGAGWSWQPVIVNGPLWLHWLTA